MLKVPQHSPNPFPSSLLPNFTLLLLFIISTIVSPQTIVKTNFTVKDLAQMIRKNYDLILGFHF